MRKAALLILVLALPLGTIPAAPARATNVNIGINVNVPPPPVLVATPRLIVIPGSPVLYAPGVEFNLFVHRGRYYSFHNGVWFHSPKRGGPWVVIQMDKVPHVVRTVPATYYRVPPGHAKKPHRAGPPLRPPGREGRHR
jgi:hypothetical protein